MASQNPSLSPSVLPAAPQPAVQVSALLRTSLKTLRHQLEGLEPGEWVRLVLVIKVGAGLLLRGASSLLDRAFVLETTPEFAGLVRYEAYRVGAFLCAILGFSTFSLLWRARDAELLNRLPIAPRAVLRFRLVVGLGVHLPLLLLSWAAFLPLFWRGYPLLGFESLLALTVMYVGSMMGGMAWHSFAGHSVTTPAYAGFKQRLAGTMVLPERTLLLYSPVFTAASGFLAGLGVLAGTAALLRGEVVFGLISAVAGASILPYAWARAQSLFDASYYSALGALSEGEILGELGEAAPETEYFGQSYTSRLPKQFQALVARDLRQAWRRARLDHLSLASLAGLLALLSFYQQATGQQATAPQVSPPPASGMAGLLSPELLIFAVWGVLALAGAQAFRLNRPDSDAPWLWLTLPIPLAQQVQARVLSTLFFPLLTSPLLLLALGWSGFSWGISALWLGGLMGASSLLAVNLSLTRFTKRRQGGTLYGLGMAVPCLAPILLEGFFPASGSSQTGAGEMVPMTPTLPLLPLALLVGLALLSMGSLRKLPETLLVDAPAR